MGACFIDVTFDASDEATLKKNFSNYSEDQRHENGHGSYSGNLQYGVRVLYKEFKDESEASEWVSNNARKWEPALAVKVGDFSKAFFNTTKGKKLLTQVTELRNKVENFDKNLLSKLAMQKSRFKCCLNCESKISVQHFVRGNGTECPVCHKEFVKSAKDSDKLKILWETLQVKEKELAIFKNDHAKKLGKKNPYWFVGGWAST